MLGDLNSNWTDFKSELREKRLDSFYNFNNSRWSWIFDQSLPDFGVNLLWLIRKIISIKTSKDNRLDSVF